MMITLEQCRIAPADLDAELSLPLTFFDLFWPDYYPMRRVLFYEFPCSKSDFVETIIPNVKRSLALALKHFPPIAGNFVYPLGPGMPEIKWKNGDSVSLVFAESDDDFSYLTGNQPRDADKFYPFVHELPAVVHVAGARLVPLLAVKVTLFPNVGISVGIINQHVVGDARTTVNFIKSWATICKFGGDAEFLTNKSLHPVFDRSLVKEDPDGKLLENNWNYLKKVSTELPLQISLKDKVRATFVIEDVNIQKLKNLAAMAGSIHHVSTFTVIFGYVWTCFAKSGAAIGEEDGIYPLFFPADYRARLDPPLPANYFGNCLGFLFAETPRSLLIGNDGFLVAAKLIGEAIYKRFSCNKEEVMKNAEDWAINLGVIDWSRVFATAGSPRFDAYDADFGWGKPKKFESLAIDSSCFVSLCKSRDSEKKLEIGLSLPKIKMDAFAKIFNDGLLGTEIVT